MRRRTFLGTTAAAALAPMAMEAATPLNVVIIFADDLGYGDLGSYGSRIPTPNLDRLAANGVQFRQFYSSSPVCSPSRAGLLTGRYGVRTGVHTVLMPTDPGGLSENEVTIAQMLKRLNYRTMCIGKWHLGRPDKYLPTARGFDEYYGIPYSNDMLPSILLHNSDVVESPVDLSTLTMRYTARAVDFVRRAKDGPFFLYWAHTFPHIPLAVSEKFAGKSEMGLYGDVVEELDWSVGQLMTALEENGLTENTLVVFSSDNGPWFQGSPGRLRGRKGDTFEGGMREPFIAHCPRLIPTQVRERRPVRRIVDAMASTLDLLPTIAGLTGAPLPPAPLDGVDIRPLLTGEAASVPRDLFLYLSGWDLQCARMGPWKLHVSRGNVPAYSAEPKVGYMNLPLLNPELYNIDVDPEEATNVSKQSPDVVLAIQDRIHQLLPSLPLQVQTAWRETVARKVQRNEPGAYPVPILP